MTRPDLFPVGRPGFMPAPADDSRGAWQAYAGIIVALVIVTLGILASLWWLDRVAEPPGLRPTIQPRASWLEGPIRAEGELAILEQPQGGRP